MNRITRAVKATYNFFAGDMILLIAVALAFGLGGLLAGAAQAPALLVGVVLIGLIVGGLVTTLAREVRGRPRS